MLRMNPAIPDEVDSSGRTYERTMLPTNGVEHELFRLRRELVSHRDS